MLRLPVLLAAVVMLWTLPAAPPPTVAALFVHAATHHATVSEAPATSVSCPILRDKCRCTADFLEFECRTACFTVVPSDVLPDIITKLDLTSNNLTELHDKSLYKFQQLQELILADNKLTRISPNAFSSNPNLKRLDLHGCGLLDIPVNAFLPLRQLQTLNLGNNLVTSIPRDAFPMMDNLTVLLLKRNQIREIEDEAFANLTSLRILELCDNLLTQIPKAVTKLSSLRELSISGNRIKYIPKGLLQRTPSLAQLELKRNPLLAVDAHAFSFLPKLRKLILSEAKGLSTFPSLNGTSLLEILRLDRAAITSVPASLCYTCPRLRSLDLKSNKLVSIPDLNNCKDMRVLDLASNRIGSLEGRPFRGMSQMHDLLLSNNEIELIPQDAFYGLTMLQTLDLESNKVVRIHPDAFTSIPNVQDLNLGNNIFPDLPYGGLENLLHIKTFNNPNLKVFPKPEAFPKIQTLVLAYAYHCCAFLPLVLSSPAPEVKDVVIFPKRHDIDLSLWNSSTNIFPFYDNVSQKLGSDFKNWWNRMGTDVTYPDTFGTWVDEYSEEEQAKLTETEVTSGRIQCLPSPGPFLPCQDLFDWWTLRCGVWIVFLCAMLGNGTVVFVLIFSRSKMDVPRFLVCNLAAADFCMGLYLGFLAVIDASTLGEFRMYAIPWQMSVGCQLAGFLGVLSSELSVFTLAVITLERNYAITHAMHLNKRLSLKHASYIMIFGWSFSIVMATLPLFSVSDYRKFAVCLPFETKDAVSLTYVVFLMFINGVAFLILMGCYLKMYCAIRGSQAWNTNDSRIAKRMALLVFTDFLCWSPIAFFSLTAAFGLQLITLEQAKVFTVFVLPLNSCCNPFLYAILTKQFKKDCVMICKAIEESRVTRGIGRCRHSSNFSNRQTPANTNSLADRSSRENQNHHAPTCTCNAKLLGDQVQVQTRPDRKTRTKDWVIAKARWMLCIKKPKRHRTRNDQYTYQIAEIQQKQHKRASSVSSSENFSSSRSDSWRHNHHCGIPLRLLDPKRRASSWLVTRKTSQDSNLSSSRNDSSGSATTASTSTWRVSRSSASSDVPRLRNKPRLTRQCAIQDESEPPGSPGRLTVRFLTTIPSAAENSMQLEDEPSILVSPSKDIQGPLYAILHAQPVTPTRRQSIVTLHPPEPAQDASGNSSQSDAGPSKDMDGAVR
ncbi:lutropin-choriogonadotropic hormone receptor isoform X2 [Onthophagus taurus]|uniref:lutropin-choriogonadotropic hormone receptor isoform X2 n=1 Tax=Onthophagus taurus TaxID=166361 RepID=UPI000C2076C5|nr:lutropin-choriogonadotropic hormone receptor isoform X2 [Onthophagus taurus]